MESLCPFHADTYVKGLSTIGTPAAHRSGHFYILKRPIEGTPYYDGVGPWPYLYVEHDRMLDAPALFPRLSRPKIVRCGLISFRL